MKKVINQPPTNKQEKIRKFKYKFRLYKTCVLSYYFKLKHLLRRLFEFVNIKTWYKTFTLWIVNVILEGLILNFTLHTLLNFTFTPLTTLAYGLIVWEIIDLTKRLRQTQTE
tara:strand:- start:1143 stop:1478 length:336 start_codon:yes stop_codon:yes gene_type:complete